MKINIGSQVKIKPISSIVDALHNQVGIVLSITKNTNSNLYTVAKVKLDSAVHCGGSIVIDTMTLPVDFLEVQP